MHSLAQQWSLMHQFLWYATHIDTGAANAPFCADWCWLHEIQAGNACTIGHCLLGACQTTRAATNHNQIVVIVTWRMRESKRLESVKREIKWRVSGYHAAEAAAWRRLRKTLLLSSGASVSPCRQNDKFCVHSMVVHRPMKRAQSRTGTLGITSALLRCHSDGALSLLLFLFLLIGDMCCSTVRIKVKQSSVPRLGRVRFALTQCACHGYDYAIIRPRPRRRRRRCCRCWITWETSGQEGVCGVWPTRRTSPTGPHANLIGFFWG